MDVSWIRTEFQTTPEIPTALIAFSVFYIDDFDKKTVATTIPITNRNLDVYLINEILITITLYFSFFNLLT